jgi:membrane protease YdiL (CAAX protease family)
VAVWAADSLYGQFPEAQSANAMIASAPPAPTTSRPLSETSKAAVFSGMLLTLALAAGLLIRAFDPPQLLAYIIWGSTPLVAVLIMMFLVTDDGRTREGRALLGLHRLGVRLWWIAILGSFLISLLAVASTWTTPFASFTTPASPVDTVLNFAVNAIVTIVTFAAAEEMAWRGYLLPRLLQLGRNRALAITGLVHAAWHLPLILLTPLYHSDGNLLIILPLFVGTIVAAGFVYGDLRIATGSIWPASIAHGVHNASWGALAGLTVTNSPVLVNEYLAGDTGLLILLTTVVAAFWLRRWLRHHPREES